MSVAQKHRGPDDDGYWQSNAEPTFSGACFAFRRLAIIDLSADGHQPMSAELAATDSIGGEADDDAEDGEDRDEGGSSENLVDSQPFKFKA